MELRQTNIDGVGVRYGIRGRGPALLMLHGWINDHTVFRHLWPLLQDAFQCILVDLPGFGASDKPSPDTYPYDAQAFCQAAVGVLDAMEIERAHLCGHSMGGGVGLVLAATHPDRIDRIVLGSPAAYATPWTFKGALARAPVIGPFIFQHLYGRAAVYDFLCNEAFSGHPTVDMKQVEYTYSVLNSPEARRAAYASLMRTLTPVERIQEFIPRVHQETLILWGDEDLLMPPENGPRLAHDLPHGRLQMLTGTSHVCFEEAPEATADHILKHLLPDSQSRI